jgi:phospholipid/cholesterol/gamma-HCH transport system ATP-binding protein
VIVVEAVSKAFKGPVLRDVSLRVAEGTITALIGPGASGKTVLLKVLTGLIRPDGGRVLVRGEEVTAMDEIALGRVRQQIGMLFQNNALFDHLSVFDNIAFPLRRLSNPPFEEVRARVAERLERVALAGFETRLPDGLSGGQRKRVGIARATITRPPIVLYDEPTAGLDPVTSQKIYNLIRDEQRADRSTVVVISSDVQGVLSIADRVAMLHRGELVFEGTAAEASASAQPALRQFLNGLDEGPL